LVDAERTELLDRGRLRGTRSGSPARLQISQPSERRVAVEPARATTRATSSTACRSLRDESAGRAPAFDSRLDQARPYRVRVGVQWCALVVCARPLIRRLLDAKRREPSSAPGCRRLIAQRAS
jgi:hypothetical protein